MMDAAWKEMQAREELHKTEDEQNRETEESPVNIRYYRSPSAFRRAGALTPTILSFTYRTSPFMGCEQCDTERSPYCFEYYNPWWKKGEIRVKTNTTTLLREVLESGEDVGNLLVDGFDNLYTERKTRILNGCLEILAGYPFRVHIQATRLELLVEYLPLLESFRDRLTVWVSVADELAFQRDMVLALAKRGILVVLTVLMFPFVNSGEEELAEIRRFADEHWLGIAFTRLRLQHEGPQREALLRWIERRNGREVVEKYRALYPADIPAGRFGRVVISAPATLSPSSPEASAVTSSLYYRGGRQVREGGHLCPCHSKSFLPEGVSSNFITVL